MNAMLVAPQAARWPELPAIREDGFVVLDACHRQMLESGLALEDLVDTAERKGFSPAVRASAAALAAFFGATAASHHEDEERHVFPALLASGEPTPVTYATPKPAAILEEDKIIEAWPLKLSEERMTTVPVAEAFER